MTFTLYKTKATIDGQEAELTYHEPMFPFDAERVRELKTIVFNDEGKILGIKKGRTFDIPTGRLEWDDDDFKDAAKREVYEQATVILDRVTLAAVIEETFTGTNEPPFYALVMTGLAQGNEPSQAPIVHKTAFLDKERFISRYRFGNPEDLRVMIETAEFYLSRQNKKPTCDHVWLIS